MLVPHTYWSRVMASWQMIGATGEQLTKTVSASQDVISARTDILRSMMQSPMTADYAELSRMVPEKIAAFSLSGNAMMHAWWNGQADYLTLASRLASHSMSGRMPTPVDMARLWTDISLGALRAMENGSRLGRDALAPIHKTAAANARRLKKRPRPT